MIDAARFWRHVQLSPDRDDDRCWLWIGALSSAGYGKVRVGARLVAAHRVAYELQIGPIPWGHMVRRLPTCSQSCVRGDHLRIDRPYRKLGELELRLIRGWLGSHSSAARRFGVTRWHVARLRSGQVGYGAPRYSR